ncbi:glycosyltransferase [Alcanivorax sp. S6407]|uniref:glycosyltransferase family 2 protein n=1 Tax=Alcanivorax sp. S6407 TaxID=2926424 RepID=UPI001FF31231|nr:glycosyltransferase family 2 protein [Alcanivorax sp. S6407]MCK0152839.1 glycosyltransferase [Alcanivorax sp. S6407]
MNFTASSEPVISVVIPCFNSEKWLAEAINSVLSQSDDRVELVIVNDGSTDGTQGVAESFGDKIVLINQANSGVSAARRNGVRRASGKYIKFLDSDDLLPDGALAVLLEAADRFQGEAIIGNAVAISSEGLPLVGNMYGLAYQPSDGDFIKKEFLLTQATQVGLWLLPKYLIDDDRFYDPNISLGEEYLFCMQIVRAELPIRYCNQLVCKIRVHSDGSRLSSTRDESKHLLQVDLISRVVDFISNEIDDYSEEALENIARLCWSRGRHCLRIGCPNAAVSYFDLGKKINPGLQPVGGFFYKVACKTWGPVFTENAFENIKEITRKGCKK